MGLIVVIFGLAFYMCVFGHFIDKQRKWQEEQKAAVSAVQGKLRQGEELLVARHTECADPYEKKFLLNKYILCPFFPRF